MIDRTTPPDVHRITSVELPQQNLMTLGNGVNVYMLNRNDVEIVRLSAVWDDGKSTIPASVVLPLMGMLLREGAGSRTPEQVNDYIDFHGGMLKFSSDMHYSMLTMLGVAGTFGKLMPLLADIIAEPHFAAGSFESARAQIADRADIELTRVSHLAAVEAGRQMFGADSPMAYAVSGADYKKLTRDDIVGVHAALITGMKPTIYLAGHISDELLAELDKTIGRIDFGARVAPGISQLVPDETLRNVTVHRPDTLQAGIVVSIPAIDRSHPDYINLRLATIALGGYFGARLMANIREDKGYTYGISAGLMGYREGGVVSISTQADCRYVEPLLGEVKREIVNLAANPPQGDELETLRRYAMSSLLMTVDNPLSISDYYILMQTQKTPADYMERQVQAINALTPDIISSMAEQYITTERMFTAIATK